MKTTQQILKDHVGHDLEAAVYGVNESFTIECLDCSVVLVDRADNPFIYRRLLTYIRGSEVRS